MAITALEVYLVDRYPKLDFTFFADDGIIYADKETDIKRLIIDAKLPLMGIKFARKIRADGTKACDFVKDDTIKFVGAALNLSTGEVTSSKGTCHINESIEKLNKIL
jgi:hypothetical protein